jgi:hypothetical protein
MKSKNVTNSALLKLATYHGNPRPGDGRHGTPANVSRLQKILDMHPKCGRGSSKKQIAVRP